MATRKLTTTEQNKIRVVVQNFYNGLAPGAVSVMDPAQLGELKSQLLEHFSSMSKMGQEFWDVVVAYAGNYICEERKVPLELRVLITAKFSEEVQPIKPESGAIASQSPTSSAKLSHSAPEPKPIHLASSAVTELKLSSSVPTLTVSYLAGEKQSEPELVAESSNMFWGDISAAITQQFGLAGEMFFDAVESAGAVLSEVVEDDINPDHPDGAKLTKKGKNKVRDIIEKFYQELEQNEGLKDAINERGAEYELHMLGSKLRQSFNSYMLRKQTLSAGDKQRIFDEVVDIAAEHLGSYKKAQKTAHEEAQKEVCEEVRKEAQEETREESEKIDELVADFHQHVESIGSEFDSDEPAPPSESITSVVVGGLAAFPRVAPQMFEDIQELSGEIINALTGNDFDMISATHAKLTPSGVEKVVAIVKANYKGADADGLTDVKQKLFKSFESMIDGKLLSEAAKQNLWLDVTRHAGVDICQHQKIDKNSEQGKAIIENFVYEIEPVILDFSVTLTKDATADFDPIKENTSTPESEEVLDQAYGFFQEGVDVVADGIGQAAHAVGSTLGVVPLSEEEKLEKAKQRYVTIMQKFAALEDADRHDGLNEIAQSVAHASATGKELDYAEISQIAQGRNESVQKAKSTKSYLSSFQSVGFFKSFGRDKYVQSSYDAQAKFFNEKGQLSDLTYELNTASHNLEIYYYLNHATLAERLEFQVSETWDSIRNEVSDVANTISDTITGFFK